MVAAVERDMQHPIMVPVVDHEVVAVGQKAKLHTAEDDEIKAGERLASHCKPCLAWSPPLGRRAMT